MREKLPNRRRGWTQKAKIGPERQVFYLTVGEYPDGRLGEIWLATHKEGTFARGLAGALARMASIALQSGTPVAEIVKSLRHLNFPPNGRVEADRSEVTVCSSVCDWVAQELENAYLRPVVASHPPAPGPSPNHEPTHDPPGPPPSPESPDAPVDWRNRGPMPPPDPAAWVTHLQTATVPPFDPPEPGAGLPVYSGDGPKVATFSKESRGTGGAEGG